MPRSNYRPSPNEQAAKAKKDFEERRKARLLQVRKQESAIAADVRDQFRRRLSSEHEQLAAQLQAEWSDYQDVQNRVLKERQEQAAKHFGDAHTKAAEQSDVPFLRTEEGIEEAKQKAQRRHDVALQRRAMEEKWLQAARSRNLEKRQSTIAAEKERSRRVASKPLKADTQLSDLLSASSSVVVGSVCSTKAPHGPTYHHLTAHAVQAQGDARNAMLDAENVENEQEVAQQLKDRSRHERVEVARVRHEHALQHVRLKRNYEEQLEELETMRKVDSLQRRKQVEHVPKHLFVTPLMRLEQQQAEEEELQRRVEAMCLNRIPSTTTTGVANSITTAVPQAYHSTSTASADRVTTALTDSVTPELSCSTLSSSAISESDVTGMQPPDGAASAHRQHAGAPVSSASSQSQPLSRLLEHVRSQQQGRRTQLSSEQVESPPAHTSARSAPAAVRGLGTLPVTSSIADERPVPSTRNLVPTRSKPTNFSQPVTSHSAL
eukprot:scpid77032/ scgid0820/ Centrosomal protein KIAA1731 homolog